MDARRISTAASPDFTRICLSAYLRMPELSGYVSGRYPFHSISWRFSSLRRCVTVCLFSIPPVVRSHHFFRASPITNIRNIEISLRLFILKSMAIHHSLAYLFTTCSAQVLPDSGASWTDYILWHLSHRFTIYALPLSRFLSRSFTCLFLQASGLHS